VDRLALRRHDTGTVDAQAVGLPDQAEFDRVPVQPREINQRFGAEPVRLDPAGTVGLHVVREQRIQQQRHVTEQVVEQVGLGDVVDLLGLADPPGHRKAPVRQMIEEGQLRQQAFDADQFPARRLAEHAIELIELRDRIRRHAEALLVVDELAAGTTNENLPLALEQRRPDVVIAARIAGPGLLDNGRRIDRHTALVGLLVFDAAWRRVHGKRRMKELGDFSTAAINRCRTQRLGVNGP
jgi:hypothetical protein